MAIGQTQTSIARERFPLNSGGMGLTAIPMKILLGFRFLVLPQSRHPEATARLFEYFHWIGEVRPRWSAFVRIIE